MSLAKGTPFLVSALSLPQEAHLTAGPLQLLAPPLLQEDLGLLPKALLRPFALFLCQSTKHQLSGSRTVSGTQ